MWLRLQLRRAAEVWEEAEEDMIEGEDGGAEVSPSRTCCVSLSKVARKGGGVSRGFLSRAPGFIEIEVGVFPDLNSERPENFRTCTSSQKEKRR